MYTELQINNSVRNFSAMNPENMGEKHDIALSQIDTLHYQQKKN